MSNLLGVVGSLSKTDMQGQAVTAGFRVKKDTGYTDKDVAFVKGVCHLFEPRYVPELWKEWKKKKRFRDWQKSPDEEDDNVCHKDRYRDISVHLHCEKSDGGVNERKN